MQVLQLQIDATLLPWGGKKDSRSSGAVALGSVTA